MSETTKKSGFKETFKKVEEKTKNFARTKTEQVKNYGIKYKSDLRTAYDTGYSRGWEDAYDIPNRMFSRLAASIGYRNGVKQRYKSDKYINRYNRKNKK